ncbi:uncharacterized protein A4U43_C05F13720 [Asparagus officinalis]|uniref:Uncharacterized protein n=1 Tax=Asparagus officinalis TaxID=4686 RepID=A0A5P1EWU1_ASPOF|nr:uncharacterized protein A4U43_C05F13720 [Asparagus officinalis]
MDSKSMAAADSVSISQCKENRGGDSLSHSEMPMVVDDDRGTTSESEDSNEEISMLAVENGGNRKLGLSKIPNHVRVKDERVEEVEGNVLGFAKNEKNDKNSMNDTNSKLVVVEVGTENNLAVDDMKSKPVEVEVEDAIVDEVEQGRG